MPPEQKPIPFVVGQQYTRQDIFRTLGLDPLPQPTGGGRWFGGYNHYGTDWYIFANIEAAGRTGHDYANRWESELLRWYGRGDSHLHQPTIQSMLRPKGHVFVITREDNCKPFIFRGPAKAERYEDTRPVTIWWRFPAQDEGAGFGEIGRAHV